MCAMLNRTVKVYSERIFGNLKMNVNIIVIKVQLYLQCKVTEKFKMKICEIVFYRKHGPLSVKVIFYYG